MELENMGDRPGHAKRAKGGAMRAEKKGTEKVHMYNAEGSPEAKEAEDQTPAFSKGGRSKRKDGGHAEGKMERHRLDRGTRLHRAKGGGTPYSSGANLTEPSDDKKARGYEGSPAA